MLLYCHCFGIIVIALRNQRIWILCPIFFWWEDWISNRKGLLQDPKGSKRILVGCWSQCIFPWQWHFKVSYTSPRVQPKTFPFWKKVYFFLQLGQDYHLACVGKYIICLHYKHGALLWMPVLTADVGNWSWCSFLPSWGNLLESSQHYVSCSSWQFIRCGKQDETHLPLLDESWVGERGWWGLRVHLFWSPNLLLGG